MEKILKSGNDLKKIWSDRYGDGQSCSFVLNVVEKKKRQKEERETAQRNTEEDNKREDNSKKDNKSKSKKSESGNRVTEDDNNDDRKNEAAKKCLKMKVLVNMKNRTGKKVSKNESEGESENESGNKKKDKTGKKKKNSDDANNNSDDYKHNNKRKAGKKKKNSDNDSDDDKHNNKHKTKKIKNEDNSSAGEKGNLKIKKAIECIQFHSRLAVFKDDFKYKDQVNSEIKIYCLNIQQAAVEIFKTYGTMGTNFLMAQTIVQWKPQKVESVEAKVFWDGVICACSEVVTQLMSTIRLGAEFQQALAVVRSDIVNFIDSCSYGENISFAIQGLNIQLDKFKEYQNKVGLFVEKTEKEVDNLNDENFYVILCAESLDILSTKLNEKELEKIFYTLIKKR
ncbi:hypothetical protein RFI_32845 [Reticulomyxa filosa]|uniref:Uncharacterized protein n=1 Tax=Reticulomyxa filosa TaxID=46433 RepID=X6LTV5_RETFI|nr:hypothetical protein RFI_32845 [Reticulomyxa filosa]|eukprot:ETO04552.1 hypothetical protein RFI_32845 [Reticulomyxa filosa]